MKKKIYLALFYFYVIFQVSQNLLSAAQYQELDRVVAIVEKEVITEVELENSIKQVIKHSKEEGTKGQYEDLVRVNVLDQLIQRSLIEQYAAQYGMTN